MQVIRKPSADHTQILAHPVQITCKSYPMQILANPVQIQCKASANPVQILPDPVQILCKSCAHPMQILSKMFANPLQILY